VGIFDTILGKGTDGIPWGYLYTTWGDVMICLPDSAPRLTDVAFVPGIPGERSWIIGHDDKGEPAAVALAALAESIALASVKSALVATGWEGSNPTLESAIVDMTAQSPIIVPKPDGKMFKVTVDEIIDDGLESGLWQGSVTMHPLMTPGWVLSIEPPFQIRPGTTFRFAGKLSERIGFERYFGPWSWVERTARIEMFSSEMMWNFACVKSGSDFDRAAANTVGAVVQGLQRMEAERLGRPVPFLLREFGIEFEQEAVDAVRRALTNSWSTPDAPRTVPSALKASPCEVTRRVNGKILVALRHRLGPKPVEANLTVLNDAALSADDQTCRLLLTLRHEDGQPEELLLSSVPQHMIERISGARHVSVREGAGFEVDYDASVGHSAAVAEPSRAPA